MKVRRAIDCHKKVIVLPPTKDCGYNEVITDEDCDGETYWDEALEGYVCTKCDLYTGIK